MPSPVHSFYEVFDHQKADLLIHLLKTLPELNAVMVCARTREGVHALTAAMNHADILAESVHGNKKPELRDRALKVFREGKLRVLVTTDAVARELDESGVRNVINVDYPEVTEDYVQRAAHVQGDGGDVITFMSPKDIGLLAKLEDVIGEKPEPKVADGFSYDARPAREKSSRKKGGKSKGPRSKPLQNKKPKLNKKFGR